MSSRTSLHISPTLRKRLHMKILRWYRANGRDLPWRRTNDPYRILLSEIMLQQTQVARVKEKYPVFLRRFPTLRTLAHASTSDVIKAWRGMGYNRRAVYLRQIAREVMEKHRGKIPAAAPALHKLPGIGKYTANAILATAFGQNVPVVDTNIRRIFTRLLKRATFPAEWKLAELLLSRSSASEWNQALMDLGALVCTARAPLCHLCPVSKECPSAYRSPVTLEKRPRNEPARHGIPNRLHRGKVIDLLRSLNGTERISERRLLRSIVRIERSGDPRWFRRLIEGLQRDGLVRVESRRNIRYIGLVR
ncbi:MAG: A/G-specific adenine glycosylase [Ignavibacteria bacterium]|nr:A/G-specific adenine glycosylase [Ignavibacteria bacterium]